MKSIGIDPSAHEPGLSLRTVETGGGFHGVTSPALPAALQSALEALRADDMVARIPARYRQ